jgi:hypothetical protein
VSQFEQEIIISLPNVANLFIRRQLMFGRFEYAERAGAEPVLLGIGRFDAVLCANGGG